MNQNFQPSFIPKGPLTSNQVFEKKRTSTFSSIVVFLFVLVLLVTGGLYVYSRMLDSEVSGLKSRLVEAEKNIDTKTINQLSIFSKKLSQVKSIVSGHMIVSSLLSSIASSTVRSVMFDDFSFETQANSFRVTMKGTANGYPSVALQEKLFKESSFVKSVNFSNIGTTEKGQIVFDVLLVVDPSVFRYNPIVVDKVKTEVKLSASSTPVSTSTPTKTSTTTSAQQDDLNIDFDLGSLDNF